MDDDDFYRFVALPISRLCFKVELHNLEMKRRPIMRRPLSLMPYHETRPQMYRSIEADI